VEDKLFDKKIMKAVKNCLFDGLLLVGIVIVAIAAIRLLSYTAISTFDIGAVILLVCYIAVVSTLYLLALGMEKLYAEIKALKGDR